MFHLYFMIWFNWILNIDSLSSIKGLQTKYYLLNFKINLFVTLCTGKEIGNIDTKSTVRTCVFSYSGTLAAYSTDTQRKQMCEINVIDCRMSDSFGKTYCYCSIIIFKTKLITSRVFRY